MADIEIVIKVNKVLDEELKKLMPDLKISFARTGSERNYQSGFVLWLSQALRCKIFCRDSD